MDEEEESEEESLFSIDIFPDHHRHYHHKEDDENDRIYVAVGKSSKSESSMDALLWTLKHAISSSSNTVLCLIHVFPVIRLIPSPLGMLPKSKVNPRLVENYETQEREKRRKLLQSYIEACSAAKVKVDTVIIESDMVSKALIDLILTLNIRKLVVGTNKSSFMRKLKSKRRSGVAKQIIQNAPETCDVKIICDGKEVIEHLITWRDSNASSLSTEEEDQKLERLSTEITRRPPLNTLPLSGQLWSVFKRV